jgi:hypothetical protein
VISMPVKNEYLKVFFIVSLKQFVQR